MQIAPRFLRLNPKMLMNISVDGNISSGKSTVVSTMAKFIPQFNGNKFNIEIIPEPLEKWCDMRGHNLLEKFYEEPVKNAFLFQHYVQLTRLSDFVNQTKSPLGTTYDENSMNIRLFERSLQNNRYCFLELAKRLGSLESPEFTVLVEWYDWLEKNLMLTLDVVVYLRTTPEIVYERMKKRNRSEESQVSLSYLASLHQNYEDWLINGNIEENCDNETKKNYQVVIIDGNKSAEEVADQVKSRIQEYLETMQINPENSHSNVNEGTFVDF